MLIPAPRGGQISTLFHLDNGRGATRKKTRFQTGYIPHNQF
ncbi:Hypothetical protein CKL_3235 [Clostridium kluyveri DSM 555]|uniref:Uncharacterized protein n=1 Tax=Clostridium kluyveri (strain ATCC 8527 / DSM 555 / NBRC 12016 / NCIMB 10680 / K1) TaxID=431943 RepID=A5N292_CLOK5|nr:Hypothetical protein CKL_3235 [Clostridium kluyveri DSM 555]